MLGNKRVAPGSRATIDLPIMNLSTHTPVNMPVHVIHGRREGPVLFVCAALHGDEINGVEIIRRLLQLSALKSMKGTLLAVPIVNIFGFLAQSRYLPDRRDLNRSFPGSEKGSMAGRLANIVLTEVVAKATHGIDLHTGAIHRTNFPQVRADLDDPDTATLADSFGVPVIINAGLREGSLRAATGEYNIPILVYEAGEALRFDETSIRAGVNGIVRAMRHLGMLKKRSAKRLDAVPLTIRASRWERAPISGILRAAIELGESVREGDRLAAISDPFGENEVEISSRFDGVVIGRDALLKTRNLAQSGFGLTLRVGAVPVSRVRRDHIDVLVAKYCLSPGNYLAMFAGGGVGLVDKLVKEDDGTQGYVLADDAGNEEPDLEGLSCRWEPLAAQRGVMLSMLIQALAEDRNEAATTYRRVIAGLTEALGYDPQQNRPVQADNMKFCWPPSGLKAEARATQGGGGYGWRLVTLYVESLFQWALNTFNWRAGAYDGKAYRGALRENSDYRRFDDTLRMVLDCSPDEVAAMEAALVGLRSEGLIAYGLHEADSALMTCLVFNLTDSEHVHFIDGADGGFAMAARQLKQQLADRLLDAKRWVYVFRRASKKAKNFSQASSVASAWKRSGLTKS